jgi:hypothetical protein
MVPTLVALFLAGTSVATLQSEGAACTEWTVCRDLAVEAAGRQDYETFHDLAWRTVQTGPKRHPDLMFLLARAQSLSGRPLDALVMLRRLADMKAVPRDALTSDDFRRVRALPGWPELESIIKGMPPPPVAEASPPGATKTPGSASAVAMSSAGASGSATTAPSAPGPTSEEALRWSSRGAFPNDVAFDVVSKRFLFGDRANRKVVAVAAPSGTPIDLVRAQSAGFYEVQAIEIDTARGDLWVATTEGGTDGSETRAAIHKLQLVSGRPLMTIQVPATDRRVRLCDLGVTGTGAVVALDCTGRRLWRHMPGSGTLRVLMELGDAEPVSLALTSTTRAYIVLRNGVEYVDLQTGTRQKVRAASGLSLAGIQNARWHGQSLFVVQETSGGARQLARVRLDGTGSRATRIESLDSALPGNSGAMTVSGEDLYYVVHSQQPEAAGSGDTIVRRMNLKRRAGG